MSNEYDKWEEELVETSATFAFLDSEIQVDYFHKIRRHLRK